MILIFHVLSTEMEKVWYLEIIQSNFSRMPTDEQHIVLPQQPVVMKLPIVDPVKGKTHSIPRFFSLRRLLSCKLNVSIQRWMEWKNWIQDSQFLEGDTGMVLREVIQSRKITLNELLASFNFSGYSEKNFDWKIGVSQILYSMGYKYCTWWVPQLLTSVHKELPHDCARQFLQKC